MEEKVEVLKSLIRCSEKSFQLLGGKKKETKFYFEGCVPRTSPLIFFKNHLSCLFHSSLEVNRFSEYTAAIETLHGRTETDCSGGALLVYFNQKALKLKKIYIHRHFAWVGIWCAEHRVLFWPIVERLKTFAFTSDSRMTFCWHWGIYFSLLCFGSALWTQNFIFFFSSNRGETSECILHLE